MGLSYGTKVAIPGGEAAIEAVVSGDPVLAATRAGEGLSWSSAAVTFSQGAQGRNRMLKFRFDNGAELLCTPDQPLLRADNRMVRARDLVPGDRLLAPDGTTFALLDQSVGQWDRGVHAVALPGHWNGSPDGHLINAGGIVAGDYLVETHLP